MSGEQAQMEQQTQFTGCVKWFNNKAGYGFITYTDMDGEQEVSRDVFVHHSELQTGGEQFRYLVQGEYVSFGLSTMDDGKVVATGVRGANGGVLMCETRNARRLERIEYVRSRGGDDAEGSRRTQGRGRGRGRGRGGRGRGRGGGRGRGRVTHSTQTPQ